MGIKKEKKKLKKGQSLVVKTRKEWSLPLTLKKQGEIEQLIKNVLLFKRVVNHQFNNLSGLVFIKTYKKELRDIWVKAGLPPELDKYELQARHWKQSLDDVYSIISSRYALTAKSILFILNKGPFTDEEKNYLKLILLDPHLVSRICLRQKIEKIPFFSKNGTLLNLKEKILKKCHQWLRRQFRKYFSLHAKAKLKFLSVINLDTNMYSVFQKEGRTYVSVMGIFPRKRIIIPITNGKLGRQDFTGNIKLIFRKYKAQVEIHRNLLIPGPSPIKRDEIIKDQKKVVAVDKGFKTVLHSSEEASDKFGYGFGQMLKMESDRLSKKNAKRNQYYAEVRHLKEKLPSAKRKNEIQKKIVNLKKNNLGRKKYQNNKIKGRNKARDFVNKAVNDVIRKHRPEVLVTENLNFTYFKVGTCKKVKRYFSSWLKKTIKNKIDLKCQEDGIFLGEVNPAYTSQICPFCDLVDRNNRKGDKFHCQNPKCGRVGDADYFASLNLKNRFFDPDIDRFTKFEKVKKILEQRFEAKVQTVEPGLVEVSSGPIKSELRKNGIH